MVHLSVIDKYSSVAATVAEFIVDAKTAPYRIAYTLNTVGKAGFYFKN
jgi:hypothetical protein